MGTQACVTELVFDHALRVRMKAESAESAADTSKSGDNTTAVATPETASQLGVEEGGSGSEDGETATAHTATSSDATAVGTASSASAKGKDKDRDDGDKNAAPAAAPAPKETRGGKNLVGRINNLVSNDLNSLENIGIALAFLSTFCWPASRFASVLTVVACSR